MRNAPAYTDGVLTLYRVGQVKVGDYPKDVLIPVDMGPIWFREMSIYDKTRIALEEAGKQVERKVCFPQYRDVDSHYFVKIEDRFSQVFNVAHGYDRQGFPVTELTLIEPENDLNEVTYE